MVVGQKVLVAESLGGLSVVSDSFRVGTYLGLRKGYPYLHAQTPFTSCSKPRLSKVTTLSVSYVPS